MIRIIINGCGGRMGRVITEMAAAEEDMDVVAGIDLFDAGLYNYPVFESFDACTVQGDVIIDFSSPRAFDAMMDYAVRTGTPAVVCTTGLSEEQVARLKEDSAKVAVLRSANMSLGVNLLMRILKEAAKTLAPAGFDIEIVEQHHNHKKDAPSGTALMLADSMNEALDGAYHYVYDRSDRSEERSRREIGISAVRGGTIPGTHSVIFAGQDEVIEFRHTAYSRGIFGKGALTAARFLAGKTSGLYDMTDVIG